MCVVMGSRAAGPCRALHQVLPTASLNILLGYGAHRPPPPPPARPPPLCGAVCETALAKHATPSPAPCCGLIAGEEGTLSAAVHCMCAGSPHAR